MYKRFLFILLNIFIGIVFVFSAFTKLNPIEFFELYLVDAGLSSWSNSVFIARFLIGIEFFLGILLILNFKLKEFTLKITIVLLIVFTIYLLTVLFIKGNKVNCNCFGTYIFLTPIESILKNLILLILCIVLYIYHKGIEIKHSKYILILSLLAGFTLPYLLNPIYISSNLTKGINIDNDKPELDILYSDDLPEKPTIDLRNGKHIMVFLSLTCPHCKIAAYKFHIINKNIPNLPIFFILNGDKKDLAGFYSKTYTQNIPYLFLSAKKFVKLSGLKLPAIYYINNGTIEKKIKYVDVTVSDIIKWLNIK